MDSATPSSGLLTLPMYAKYKLYYCLSSDLNECLANPCHQNATCSNTPGSHKCECDSDFYGNGLDCIGMYALMITEMIKFTLHKVYYVLCTHVPDISKSR